MDTCPTCGHDETIMEMTLAALDNLKRAQADTAKWKARAEAEAESLRLAMDEGVRAW